MQFNEQNIIRTTGCSTLNMGSVLTQQQVLFKTTTKALFQLSNIANEAEDLKSPSGNT